MRLIAIKYFNRLTALVYIYIAKLGLSDMACTHSGEECEYDDAGLRQNQNKGQADVDDLV